MVLTDDDFLSPLAPDDLELPESLPAESLLAESLFAESELDDELSDDDPLDPLHFIQMDDDPLHFWTSAACAVVTP